MKFLFSLFAASAIAAHVGTPVVKKANIVERDIATVTSAISSISDSLNALNTQVQNFNGAGQVAALQSASSDVLTAINNGNMAVSSSATLSESDALTLTGPVQALGSTVSSTIDALIAKKAAFDSAGVGGVVSDQLQQQQAATQTFATTLTGKVPSSLQSIAMQLAAPITDALQKGVDAFKGDTSSGGAGGATTSAEGSAPTATSEGGSSPTSTEEGSSPATTTEEGSAPTETGSGEPTATSEGGSLPTTTGSSGGSSGNGTVSGSIPSPTIFTGAAPLATAATFGGALAALAALAAL